jgi:hypothetical protein
MNSASAAPTSKSESENLAWLGEAEQAARELEREEHEQACEEAVALRDVTYGRERSAVEKRIEAQAMSLCLEEVTAAEILPLMQATIQNHTKPFPPKAPDLLRRYRGEEWIEDGGKAERVVVANASAYQPLAPTPNEIAFREATRGAAKALPACEGTGRSEGTGRADWGALGEKLGVATPKHLRMSDNDLLAALHRSGMPARWDVDETTRRLMIEFGRWLLQHARITAWHESYVREMWDQWQRERQKQAVTA